MANISLDKYRNIGIMAHIDADASKRTPLMLAVKEGRLAIVQELFLKNPNLNAKDIQGKTALDIAEQNATEQNSEDGRAIVSLLRARGAIRGTPPTIPNWRNNAPRQARR
jgi:ankyrin repeat protein